MRECKLFKRPRSPWGVALALRGADYRGFLYAVPSAQESSAGGVPPCQVLRWADFWVNINYSCPFYQLLLLLCPLLDFGSSCQIPWCLSSIKDKVIFKARLCCLTFVNVFIYFNTLILIYPGVKLQDLRWLFYHHKEHSKFFLLHWNSEIISTFWNPKSYF